MKVYKRSFFFTAMLWLFLLVATINTITFLAYTISDHTHDMLTAVAVKDTRQQLKAMVNSEIARIDQKRKAAVELLRSELNILSAQLQHLPVEQLDFFLRATISEYQADKNTPQLFAALYNTDSDSLTFYGRQNKQFDRYEEIQADFRKELSVKQCHIMLYAYQEDVDLLVKQQIYNELASADDTDNTHFWVNQILNFKGGERYAIRIINPRLKTSEGTYLSTGEQDLSGNFPYRTELEGLLEDGELFQSRHFKNDMGDAAAEEYEYAKLYKPFQWVVAVGKPVQDTVHYADALFRCGSKYIRRLAAIHTAVIISIFVLAFAGLTVLFLRALRRLRKADGPQNWPIDALHGNEQMLCDSCSAALKKGRTLSLFLIDVDNMHRIDRRYGRKMAQTILKQTALCIQETIGVGNRIYSWGDDSFVVIASEENGAECSLLANKIIRNVGLTPYLVSDEYFHITVSIGGTLLTNSDIDLTQPMTRAEHALKRAKEQGKNCYVEELQ